MLCVGGTKLASFNSSWPNASRDTHGIPTAVAAVVASVVFKNVLRDVCMWGSLLVVA
jgi:hypothetical protein